MRIKFSNWLRLSVAAVVTAIISAGIAALYYTPWDREISVMTTPNAFVGPALGLGHEDVSPGLIPFGITPAPWPEEAHTISRAARRGKIVRVTVMSTGQSQTFDVVGVSPNGNLLASVQSMSDPELISAMLLGTDEGFDGTSAVIPTQADR